MIERITGLFLSRMDGSGLGIRIGSLNAVLKQISGISYEQDGWTFPPRAVGLWGWLTAVLAEFL
jgi:hypothetical protein